MDGDTTHMDAAVQALLDRGEESGCIQYSEVDEVAQTLDLEDEQVQEVYEEIERRGIDLKDNCARESAPAKQPQPKPPEPGLDGEELESGELESDEPETETFDG